MIKGRATIQLFDEKTGEVVREIHEKNMITNAVDTLEHNSACFYGSRRVARLVSRRERWLAFCAYCLCGD